MVQITHLNSPHSGSHEPKCWSVGGELPPFLAPELTAGWIQREFNLEVTLIGTAASLNPEPRPTPTAATSSSFVAHFMDAGVPDSKLGLIPASTSPSISMSSLVSSMRWNPSNPLTGGCQVYRWPVCHRTHYAILPVREDRPQDRADRPP